VEPLVFCQSKRDQLDIDHIDRPHHNDHQKVVKHDASSASMLHIQCACGCATTEDDLVGTHLRQKKKKLESTNAWRFAASTAVHINTYIAAGIMEEMTSGSLTRTSAIPVS
jgi:hypothetical protein